MRLAIQREDGRTDQIMRIGPGDTAITAADGRVVPAWRVTLPPLPCGRHRLIRDDAPDVAATLIVAPARCYLPPDLAGGARRFGISAHLYALRGRRDQGIGDFSVLGEFAAAAAGAGAATVGLNPLHALFSNDRERASPYHPSDRRFLDPIYVDVTALPRLLDAPELAALVAASAGAFDALRALRLVDYPKVWAAKRPLLEAAFRAFTQLARERPEAAPVMDHAAFVAAGGEALRGFARFEAMAETRPDAPRRDAAVAANTERSEFHQFLQWLADRGLRDAAAEGTKAGLSLGLYRDLAIGAAPDGAEVWAAGGRTDGRRLDRRPARPRSRRKGRSGACRRPTRSALPTAATRPRPSFSPPTCAMRERFGSTT